MKKYYFLLLLLLTSFAISHADNVKFIVSAPPAVVEGSQFNVQYILEGGDATGRDFQLSSDIKGLQVLFGPQEDHSNSIMIVNGQTTSQSSATFTYTLLATKAGTYSIPSAKVKSGGSYYTSNSTTIKVLPPDKNAKKGAQGQSEATTSSSVGTRISPNDAFIRTIISKTKVKEQEAINVTYRLYTVLNVTEIGDAKFPEFDGFIKEDIPMSGNRQLQLENYNGRNYYTADLKKALLFPQHSGKITVPGGSLELGFEVRTGRQGEDIFGMPFEEKVNVNKVLKISPVVLNIGALPKQGKPINFSGGVGTFDITSSISSQNVKENDAVTLRYTIQGTGNLKLVRTPQIQIPDEFEKYDPKETNNYTITSQGISGSRTFEYLFIPRNDGDYKIPSYKFSFFDPKSNSYKTITTEAYNLKVAKDPHNKSGNQNTVTYTGQTLVKVQNDIRYIKTDKYHFNKTGKFLWGSIGYILCYIILIILFVALYYTYRKQIKMNSDVALMRTKKANKVALKKLKTAKLFLANHNKDGFYEEILRAIWGYLSDKVLIPVANLNRENIENEMIRYGVHSDIIKQFIEILDTCEFARYAPSSDENAEMDKIFNQTMEAIEKMENTIKKVK